MSTFSNIKRSAIFIGATALCAACASTPDFNRHLGVMPLQPPPPVWLGSIHSSGAARIAGAAAVTPSQTPGWAHVLISLDDMTTGGLYSWTLRAGSCGSPGAVLGSPDRFADFPIRPDGSGAADALVPMTLSVSQTYAVIATPVDHGTASVACADLVHAAL